MSRLYDQSAASIKQKLPDIHYLARRDQKGAHTLTDDALPMQCGSFEDVFQKHHFTDAHFVTYEMTDRDGDPDRNIPRLTKGILPEIRKAGGDVLTTMFVFDWDTPGHVALTQKMFDEFFQSLLNVGAAWPPALQWTLCYSTRKGARLVYALKTPVPVDRGEGFHRGMIQEFHRRGIEMDASASDWTRLFRLPYVMRDNRPTWEDGDES